MPSLLGVDASLVRVRLLLAFATAIAALTAHAADGVLEISDTCATQTGCFSGDGAGYPVTISQSGSYVLTSNLSVPPGASGIAITADDVGVDLNGFAIRGGGTCAGEGSAISCTGASGFGISAPGRSRTVVRNGIVRGFIAGLRLEDECVVENVIAVENSQIGIVSDRHCRLLHNVVLRNGTNGIDTDRGNVITGIAALGNGVSGIRMRGTGSSLRANAAALNGSVGMICFRNCVVERNAIFGNEGTGLSSTGGGSIVTENAVCQNDEDQIVLSDLSGFTTNVVQEGMKVGGLVTDGVYMPENVCNGVIGAAACTTVP